MNRVTHHQEGDIAVIRLDDGKVNAMQAEMLTQLNTAIDQASAANAKAVVLTGRAGCFCAGLDLKTLPGLDRATLRETLGLFTKTMLRVFALDQPVIAAITGHALAGGCVLSLACDRRIGQAGPFRVGLNEVQIGIPLPNFLVEFARLALDPRALGRALLAGEIYDPESAQRVGYLDEVAPDAQARAMELARQLANLSPYAYGETKRRLRAAALERGRATEESDLEGYFTGPLALGS